MPRWLWITLASLLLLLGWLGLRSPPPVQLTMVGANGASDCPLPQKFDNPNLPRQTDVGNRIAAMKIGRATFTPLAGISLQARVLSRENYYVDEGSEFSKTDLALGWGPMADIGMAKKLNVSQSGRFYRYNWGNEGPPIPQSDIISNSANMHLVPANSAVADSLSRIRPDEIVELDGWLIRIDRADGWHWQSSLTRDDSGNGACELVYVCRIKVTQ